MSQAHEAQHPDLFGLLRGELSNADVGRVADHLDTCQHCRDELAEVAVGHALLAGTTRTLAHPAPVDLPVPVAAAPAPPPPRWRRPVLLLVAAALLVAGSATVTALLDRDPAPPAAVDTPGPSVEPSAEPSVEPSTEPDQQAELQALPPAGEGTGRVLMAQEEGARTVMTVETRDLPRLRGGGYYYVWLLDPETNKMLPVGQIGPGGSASFELPLSLLGRYSEIDISLETDDGDPGHSFTSVLHASYAPTAES